MTTTSKTALALVTLLVAALAAISLYAYNVRASAPSGLISSVATSSNPTVSSTASLVFATSTACAARVVTTYASPVTMYFSDKLGQRPSGSAGHLQAASTTVVYDSGLYGCGAVYMFGFTSTAITVTETR